jgi:hypothetical protein
MTGIISDVHTLNLIGDSFLYRIRLTGLITLYGRDSVQRALVKEAAQAGENVVSVAAAQRWRTTKHDGFGPATCYVNGATN